MRNTNSQAGIILTSATIMLVLLASMISLSFLFSQSIMETQSLALRGYAENERTYSSLLSLDISSLASNSTDGVTCSKALGGEHKIEREICIFKPQEIPMVYNKKNLWFNTSALFKSFSNCDLEQHLSEEHSSFGLYLGTTSIIFPSTCKTIASEISHFVINGNIEASDPITLKALSDEPYSILAATGYIDLNGKLDVENDLVIFAGGELRIKELYSKSQINLTIISSSGAVTISKLDGSPNLYIYGRKGETVLSEQARKITPTSPFIKEAQILGIIKSY